MVSLWLRAENNMNHLTGEEFHGPATDKRPIVEAAGKIYCNITVGCSNWCLTQTTRCEGSQLMVTCVCTCLCVFFLTQPIPCLGYFRNWALWCQLVQSSFSPTAGHRLISQHWLLCSLPSETIQYFVSIFIRPGFNLWYLGMQVITVCLFLSYNYGKKKRGLMAMSFILTFYN